MKKMMLVHLVPFSDLVRKCRKCVYLFSFPLHWLRCTACRSSVYQSKIAPDKRWTHLLGNLRKPECCLSVIYRVCLCLYVQKVNHCSINFGIICRLTLLSYSSAFMLTGAFPTAVINMFINLLWTRKYVGFRSQELRVRARELSHR